MSTATRLGAYGAALLAVFGGAFVAADALVPQSVVTSWNKEAQGHEMNADTPGHGGHDARKSATSSAAAAPVPGVTSAAGGYQLSPVAAPAAVGETGKLSFQILDTDGDAVTELTTSHEKKLHLIVVRTDGTQFRHVHPTVSADGTWSLPWDWPAAGTYRVYADFVPAAGPGKSLTLTRTAEVAGAFTPAPPEPTNLASVNGFDVELTGDLVAGSSSDLTFTVSRDGKPVTAVQPYLGAFGHLVALREGDLAYLHVHPEADDPAAGELAGPEIGFLAEAPTRGRYLLYLDFQVDGTVHTAPFVVDTATARPTDRGTDQGHTDSGAGDGHGH